MTVAKVTVSLDPEVAARVRQDVADGKAKSVSAWLNDAAQRRMTDEDLEAVLADLFESTGGPPSASELTVARRRLEEADRT